MAVSHRVLIGEIYLPLPELVQYYFGRETADGRDGGYVAGDPGAARGQPAV